MRRGLRAAGALLALGLLSPCAGGVRAQEQVPAEAEGGDDPAEEMENASAEAGCPEAKDAELEEAGGEDDGEELAAADDEKREEAARTVITCALKAAGAEPPATLPAGAVSALASVLGSPTPEQLEDAFAKLAAADVSIRFTELDLTLRDGKLTHKDGRAAPLGQHFGDDADAEAFQKALLPETSNWDVAMGRSGADVLVAAMNEETDPGVFFDEVPSVNPAALGSQVSSKGNLEAKWRGWRNDLVSAGARGRAFPHLLRLWQARRAPHALNALKSEFLRFARAARPPSGGGGGGAAGVKLERVELLRTPDRQEWTWDEKAAFAEHEADGATVRFTWTVPQAVGADVQETTVTIKASGGAGGCAWVEMAASLAMDPRQPFYKVCWPKGGEATKAETVRVAAPNPVSGQDRRFVTFAAHLGSPAYGFQAKYIYAGP